MRRIAGWGFRTIAGALGALGMTGTAAYSTVPPGGRHDISQGRAEARRRGGDRPLSPAVGGKEGDVAADSARVRAFVIPTNEELLIARDTVRCVRNAPRRW